MLNSFEKKKKAKKVLPLVHHQEQTKGMAGCRESFSYHLNLLKEVAQIGTKKWLKPHAHSRAVIRLQTTSPAEARGLESNHM